MNEDLTLDYKEMTFDEFMRAYSEGELDELCSSNPCSTEESESTVQS